jgi:hypothetical protein
MSIISFDQNHNLSRAFDGCCAPSDGCLGGRLRGHDDLREKAKQAWPFPRIKRRYSGGVTMRGGRTMMDEPLLRCGI